MPKYTTYTYRIYPNKSQRAGIDLTFKSCREIYNNLLNARLYNLHTFKKEMKKCEKMKSVANRSDINKKLKNPTIPSIKEKFPEFKKADSIALCSEWKHLNRAFANYFRHRCKIPKYKKRGDKNSYTTFNVYENLRIEKGKVRLPKIGFVKTKMHRELPEEYILKKCTVANDKCGRYYVHLCLQIPDRKIEERKVENVVGLDFKVGDVYVSSDGELPKYNKPYRGSLNTLRKHEKNLIRKKKFSKNWWRNIERIRKLHKKIVFKRKDLLHKLSARLAKIYDLVCIETLSMVDISKKLLSGINTYDTSYYRFVAMLEYKLANRGKHMILIGKWFPSSKICSTCGNVKEKLELSERIYLCQYCSNIIDRDLNAAINICREGVRLFKNTCLGSAL